MAHVLAPSDYGSLVGTTVSGGKLFSPAGVVLGPVREIPTSPDSALTVPLVSQVPDEPTTAAFDQPPLCWYMVWYDRWGRVIHEELLWCDDWGLGPGSDTVSVEISCGEGDGEAGTESAERGDPVGCSIELDQGELEWVEWTFTGDSIGERTKKLTGEQGFVWPGKAVESVEVEATLRIVLGPELTTEVEAPSVDLTVTERGWTWSEAAHRYEWHNGAIPCSGWRGAWGRTEPIECNGSDTKWFDIEGFSVSEGIGPWGSLHYLSNPDAAAEIRSILHPDLHENGPPHSLAGAATTLLDACREQLGEQVQEVSVYAANMKCFPVPVPGYQGTISHVTVHEERHQKVVKDIVAEQDIYVMWDALFSKSATGAEMSARTESTRVERLIMTKQRAVDHPPPRDSTDYKFWYPFRGVYRFITLTLPNDPPE